MKRIVKFTLALLYVLDLLGSALTGGEEGQTISARLYIEREKKTRWTRLANAVDAVAAALGERDHCHLAYLMWLARLRALQEIG